VQVAGDDASHADIIEAYIALIDESCQDDLVERLFKEHGLTPSQLVEIASSVRNSDAVSWATSSSHQSLPASAEARSAIRNLYLRNVSPERIADVLDLEVGLVQGFIDGQHINTQYHEVLRDHREGFTPLEISKRRAVPRSTVTKVIVDAGETPHRKYRSTPEAVRAGIIQMRQQGKTYGEIREAFGVDTTVVRNTLHNAKKRGLL
jgi:hypothetical protein